MLGPDTQTRAPLPPADILVLEIERCVASFGAANESYSASPTQATSTPPAAPGPLLVHCLKAGQRLPFEVMSESGFAAINQALVIALQRASTPRMRALVAEQLGTHLLMQGGQGLSLVGKDPFDVLARCALSEAPAGVFVAESCGQAAGSCAWYTVRRTEGAVCFDTARKISGVYFASVEEFESWYRQLPAE